MRIGKPGHCFNAAVFAVLHAETQGMNELWLTSVIRLPSVPELDRAVFSSADDRDAATAIGRRNAVHIFPMPGECVEELARFQVEDVNVVVATARDQSVAAVFLKYKEMFFIASTKDWENNG